jgi:hypothetical protein
MKKILKNNHTPLKMLRLSFIILTVLLSFIPVTYGQIADEPGMQQLVEDEPALFTSGIAKPSFSETTVSSPKWRIETAFGYSSLVVDPDVGEGMGGGLFFGYRFQRWLGAELSVFFSHNPYEGELSQIGTSFLAGNINLGPVLQLTPPGSRLSVSIDTSLGAYIVVPIVQQSTWTLGVSAGLSFAVHLTDWMGVGVKCRYHLFNLAHISGPEIRDIKSFMNLGVIDRLEIPAYLAFYF